MKRRKQFDSQKSSQKGPRN